MNINLYGYGFVGKAYYEVLRHGCKINIIDPKYHDQEIKDFVPDAAIICVSTPQAEDGSCDMRHIHEVMNQIDKNIPVLIKSTISLEGWKTIKESFPEHSINFSPEFLRAVNYLNDIKNTDNILMSHENSEFWINLFKLFWKDATFTVRDTEELILIKYFRNSFLATKVSFFNQIYDLCEKLGLSYETVSDGVAMDPRIGFSHTYVTDTRGWGGMCFPKDTSAIVETAKNNGVDLSLIEEAMRYNRAIRNENFNNRT